MKPSSKRHPLIGPLVIYRMALGLTQEDVARIGGLNRNTVITIESGKRNPSLDMFTKYCTGLGVHMDIAMGEPKPIALPEPPKKRDIYTIVQAAERLYVSRSTMYTLIRQGRIGSVKKGRFRIFTEDHLNAFIKENQEGSG